MMSRIEAETGLRMADMVDIFAGPSTGAILNAALTIPHPDNPNRPKYRARHLVRFYEREGLKIFPQDQFREFRGIIHDSQLCPSVYIRTQTTKFFTNFSRIK